MARDWWDDDDDDGGGTPSIIDEEDEESSIHHRHFSYPGRRRILLRGEGTGPVGGSAPIAMQRVSEAEHEGAPKTDKKMFKARVRDLGLRMVESALAGAFAAAAQFFATRRRFK